MTLPPPEMGRRRPPAKKDSAHDPSHEVDIIRIPAAEPVHLHVADDADRAAESINGMFVAVVSVTTDKVRRYPFVTLAAAQRRVDRAREAGHEASVILAELRPVYYVPAVVR